MVIAHEVNRLLRCRDKVDESFSLCNDVLKIVYTSPRIHREGFLLGPIRVSKVSLRGFVCHLDLGDVLILIFINVETTDIEATCNPAQ